MSSFLECNHIDRGQITGGEVNAQAWIISLAYSVLFIGYGLHLMRRKAPFNLQAHSRSH